MTVINFLKFELFILKKNLYEYKKAKRNQNITIHSLRIVHFVYFGRRKADVVEVPTEFVATQIYSPMSPWWAGKMVKLTLFGALDTFTPLDKAELPVNF